MASATTTTASKKLTQGTNLQDVALQNASKTYVSDNTKAAQANLANYQNNPYKQFNPSQSTNDAYQYWQSVQANRPDDYKSNYSNTISGLLDKIVNREDFSYDFNADPLYQNYKNQYAQMGKAAMKDTISQASNMTGGYGNSYATTAGSQAYQNYLQQLNDKIPELYNQAMQKYQMDTNNLMQKYNAVGNQEDREFGQWNTNMGIWQNDRNYGLSAYQALWDQDFRQNEFNYRVANDDRNFAYNNYRDSVSDDNNAYNNAYNAANNALNYEYQMNRDSVADDQWAKNFAYQQERDKVKDDQWAAEFALKKAAAARASASKSSSNNNKKSDPDWNKLTDSDKKIMKTDDYKNAYDHIYYILNNTYGQEGEYTAIAALTNMVNDGSIRESYADTIMKNLNLNPEDFDPEEIAMWAKNSGFKM